MEEWRHFVSSSGVGLFEIIEQLIRLAHKDHHDELRVRRDGLAELLFTPRMSDCYAGSSNKTNASSGVYNEDVEEEPHCVKHEDAYGDESEEEEDEHRREEEGKELVVLGDSDSVDDEPAGRDGLPHVPFDDEVSGDEDEETEKLLLNEIHSIKKTIDRHLPEGKFLPEDKAQDILFRLGELQMSVTVLKDTEIGRSVSKYRRHPVRSVRTKAREIYSAWKSLVEDYMLTNSENLPVVSASAQDDAAPVVEEEVGLASPPFDDGFVDAMVDVRELFNLSESDLSAASGPSPASDGPPVVQGRKFSSSHVQELVGGDETGVGRVLKVDKHRPAQMEPKPDHNQRNATNSSVSMRRAPNAPTGVRSNNGINGATAPRVPATGSDPPRQQSQGGVRKSDSKQRPNVGGIRPRAETTKPGVGTVREPISNDLNARKLEASKRRLHENYQVCENAKKQRTVRPLELTELPKGGPKAQRPGQQRGFVRPVR